MEDTYYSVYQVIENPCGNTKIGFTSNYDSRFVQLQSANGNELTMFSLGFFETKEEALQGEKLIHSHLAEYRLKGEWFSNAALEYLEKILPEVQRKWCEGKNPCMPKEHNKIPDDVDFELIELSKE